MKCLTAILTVIQNPPTKTGQKRVPHNKYIGRLGEGRGIGAARISTRRRPSAAIGVYRHSSAPRTTFLKISRFAPRASLGGTAKRRSSISPAFQGLSRDFRRFQGILSHLNQEL